MMKRFTVIAALHQDTHGIGKCGTIPWHIKEDMLHFKHTTLGGTVIMGSKTWESIGRKILKGRTNIVVSQTLSQADTACHVVPSLTSALLLDVPDPVFVIGGERLYNEAVTHRMCQKMSLTQISGAVASGFDRFFPRDYHLNFNKVYQSEEKICPQKDGSELKYSFQDWLRIPSVNPEEEENLNVMEQIIMSPLSNNRTGVKTWSKFGVSFKYDLRDGRIPLQTTRKMWLRGVFEEFKWIISGDTDANRLAAKGVKIWLPNSTRDFLDRRGLTHFREGDIGATYGFSMRHFGAKYNGCEADYTGQGFDQLADAIRLLKTDPMSRRIVINLWDPQSLNDTALPPCMFCYTFYYDESTNELSLMLTQRSNDFVTARSWNDTFGSLMLLSLANIANMKPGYLLTTITNAHVYQNHYDAAITQISRIPRQYPKLTIKKKLDTLDDLLNLQFSDLELTDYNPYPSIQIDMVA